MRKTIALVAHDNRKRELMEWAWWNRESLAKLDIVCTGTTGKLLEETLADGVQEPFPSDTQKEKPNHPRQSLHFNILRLKSGPLGGDQQLGALIVEGKIDLMVFFWDPMQPQAHDVDVKALLRITVLYNVPTACNRSTADFLISSSLFHQDYKPKPFDVDDYLHRSIDL
jgi:methylglyoxal synthase